MSTVFEAYPRIKDLPTFRAILDRSTAELHRFLDSIGIRSRPQIHVWLQRGDDHAHVPLSLTDPARWSDDVYAWFMVGDVSGGTDAYFSDDEKKIQEYWDDEGRATNNREFDSLVRQCVKTGHCWSFRRSAGQSASINVADGLIAGSLAAITEGFVYSIDGAWDPDRLPARPEDLLSAYFRPELALDQGEREWLSQCIGQIAEELGEAG